jgi:predicted RNA-binding protein YlxR (DUF448 family)
MVAVPERTCIGCRARGSRSELLRIVARPPFAIADPAAVLPGRGAWIHRSQQCVDQAVRRRAFGRALRVQTALDPAPVGEYLAERLAGAAVEADPS